MTCYVIRIVGFQDTLVKWGSPNCKKMTMVRFTCEGNVILLDIFWFIDDLAKIGFEAKGPIAYGISRFNHISIEKNSVSQHQEKHS